MPRSSHPYERLHANLAKLISTTLPGERLPTEPLLAQQLGVSRATLREAMRSFEGQGLIRRKQGVGTFVVEQTQVIDTGLEVLESIETLSQRIHLNVSMDALIMTEIEADEQLAGALNVPLGQTLNQVSRVIRADKRPVAFLIDILPLDIVTAEDMKSQFTGSVLDVLLRRGTPPLANSRTEIKAVDATSDVARALEIQRGDGLLMFVASLSTVNGRVIDYSYSYFLPGYFRFHVIRRVGPDNSPTWNGPDENRR
jgi:GntR family transcriptional regulator